MKKNNKSEVPNEQYIPFVESLYANRSVVLFGIICQCVIAYAIGVETGEIVFFYFVGALFFVGALRSLDIFAFAKIRARSASLTSASRWEIRYSIGATCASFLVGSLAGVSIYFGHAFAEFASMTLAMAAMVTVVGKNFASKRLVAVITAALFFPMFVGLLVSGHWTSLIGAVLLLPFGASVISMSSSLREFLSAAVGGRIQVAKIAAEFDVALNHMPHGLIMFDPNHNAIVVNKRAALMMRAKSSEMMVGRGLKVILRFCRFRGVVGSNVTDQIEARLIAMLKGQDERRFLLQTGDGSHIEFSAKKIADGGGVLIFEDVSERIDAEDKIHRMARYDALCGLPNRVYFKDLVRSNLANGDADRFAAFFVIDIDDFKHVNDSMGHPVGDELLCRFADRIRMLVDDGNCFSRFGGDEFVGLMAGFQSSEEAENAARQALHSLSGNYEVGGHQLLITVSAGIVVSRVSAFELSQMMIKSDLALYESKSKGKGISTLFAEAMDERYQRRQRLKSDLKQAIRERKLNVFYQPIIDAHTMRIATCEALCRWDHPELGPISPAIFIPLAEETGAITDLTRFMLEQACEDCTTWEGDVSVAVNLSAMDFRSSSIEEMVRVALAKSRLKPSRLEVEVTESAILEDHVGASHILNTLKKAGIRIALDDFGTGYSSLSYLHNLPLDKVKIDQSFVKDIATNDRSMKLVAGVTRLADELGLIVTVEGIETLEQFERLREHAHIDLAQGFLFGAALSPRGIATLIKNVFPISAESKAFSRAS